MVSIALLLSVVSSLALLSAALSSSLFSLF